jgi:hypothetical protein
LYYSLRADEVASEIDAIDGDCAGQLGLSVGKCGLPTVYLLQQSKQAQSSKKIVILYRSVQCQRRYEYLQTSIVVSICEILIHGRVWLCAMHMPCGESKQGIGKHDTRSSPAGNVEGKMGSFIEEVKLLSSDYQF